MVQAPEAATNAPEAVCSAATAGQHSVLAAVTNAAWQYLSKDRISARLAAAGYAVHELQEGFFGLADAYNAGFNSPGEDAAAATRLVDAFALVMQAFGKQLCALATPIACNNPSCSNISGPTDIQLVSGRSGLCASCQVARYCSRACQKQHWKQHKPVCKALAAQQAN